MPSLGSPSWIVLGWWAVGAWAAAAAAAPAADRGPASGSAPVITLGSLLEEMVDRDRLARLPQPEYCTGQASRPVPAVIPEWE